MMTTESSPSRIHSRSLVATLVLVLALALQALGGLLLPWLYRDSLRVATALRGSDITTLVLIIPLLILLDVLIRRGSLRAQLAWVGVVFYVWENNLYYLAGCAFNQLFLVYVAISVLSLFELIFRLLDLHSGGIDTNAVPSTPRKVVSFIMVAMAGILGALWLGQSATYLLTGKMPQMLIDAGGSTNLVAAFDLSILVPLLLLGASLLWRARAWGTIVSAGMLVQCALVTVSLTIMSAVQAAAGLEGAWTMLPLWDLMGVCLVAGAILLFKNISGRSMEENMSNQMNAAANPMSKRIGYAVMLGLSIVLVALAVVAALPAAASKTNVVGYVSYCPFVPWSTLTLLALAGVSCLIRSRFFRRA